MSYFSQWGKDSVRQSGIERCKEFFKLLIKTALGAPSRNSAIKGDKLISPSTKVANEVRSWSWWSHNSKTTSRSVSVNAEAFVDDVLCL
ncbi:hypothetical protein IFR05_015351 [Cadophora sp. M221]|nr:hypothetical protein IFR05_015351 [Cadophora sp. M221]